MIGKETIIKLQLDLGEHLITKGYLVTSGGGGYPDRGEYFSNKMDALQFVANELGLIEQNEMIQVVLSPSKVKLEMDNLAANLGGVMTRLHDIESKKKGLFSK